MIRGQESKLIVRILHLSDLQSSYDQDHWWVSYGQYNNKLHKLLCDFLNKHVPGEPIDLVLVTGDIAQHGCDKEYKAPKEMVDSLLGKLDNNPQLLIIPGNHDVNREKAKKAKEDFPNNQRMYFIHKFEDYNKFTGSFSNDLETRFETPYIKKEITKEYNSGKISIRIIGLNSCMESPQRDYGIVGSMQLGKLSEWIDTLYDTPYTLKIAAFHHNPLLLSSPAEDYLVDLIRSHKGKLDYSTELKPLQDYLHNSEDVLKTLSEKGFSLVLHGHQHFDGVLWINFPGEGGQPFVRQGIAAFGAGSIIGYQHPTRSFGKELAPSAQLLTIEVIPWGWRITIERISIDINDISNPKASLTHKTRFHIPRAKILEPILAVSKTFENIHNFILKPPQQPEEDKFIATEENLSRYVIWQANNSNSGINPEIEIFEDENKNQFDKNLIQDLRKLTLYGLRDWANGKNVYGDNEFVALKRLKIHNKSLKAYVEAVRFAHTRIINWQIQKKILTCKDKNQPMSFREKWILSNNLFTNKNDRSFFQKFPYLNSRNEVTVVATFRQSNKTYLIIRKRCKEHAVGVGEIMLFTSGACRISREDVEKKKKNLVEEGAIKEMMFETGFNSNKKIDSEFNLIGLYLDPLHFTPVWFYLLQIGTTDYNNFFEPINPQNDEVVELNKKPDAPGRDEWEAPSYYAVPIINNEEYKDLYERICKGIERLTNRENGLTISDDPSVGLWLWYSSFQNH